MLCVFVYCVDAKFLVVKLLHVLPKTLITLSNTASIYLS